MTACGAGLAAQPLWALEGGALERLVVPWVDNVILVGFMGAGKSSVGRLLARRLGRCFVETDDMITAREGRSIPEIFAAAGRGALPRARGGGGAACSRSSEAT